MPLPSQRPHLLYGHYLPRLLLIGPHLYSTATPSPLLPLRNTSTGCKFSRHPAGHSRKEKIILKQKGVRQLTEWEFFLDPDEGIQTAISSRRTPPSPLPIPHRPPRLSPDPDLADNTIVSGCTSSRMSLTPNQTMTPPSEMKLLCIIVAGT